MTRLAVVLFNLGGPDSLQAVKPFLFNLFRDPAIITSPALLRYPLAALISTTREKIAQANYAIMGGASPLLPETRAQAEALEAELKAKSPGLEARCFIAMRYWNPFAKETAEAVAAFAPDEIVLLPLYPQYSTTTTASSLKDWLGIYKGPGRTRTVCCYPTARGLIEAHAEGIRRVWTQAGKPEGLRLLFSAHGLPQKVVDAGDPYRAQVEAMAEAIAAKATGIHRLEWSASRAVWADSNGCSPPRTMKSEELAAREKASSSLRSPLSPSMWKPWSSLTVNTPSSPRKWAARPICERQLQASRGSSSKSSAVQCSRRRLGRRGSHPTDLGGVRQGM